MGVDGRLCDATEEARRCCVDGERNIEEPSFRCGVAAHKAMVRIAAAEGLVAAATAFRPPTARLANMRSFAVVRKCPTRRSQTSFQSVKQKQQDHLRDSGSACGTTADFYGRNTGPEKA